MSKTVVLACSALEAPLSAAQNRMGTHHPVVLADRKYHDSPKQMRLHLMELLDSADFEWTLTYDEFDYVMEGTLEIVLDSGTVLTGHPGDVLYIPKNTHIHFRTPNQARYVYFVFPANWQET